MTTSDKFPAAPRIIDIKTGRALEQIAIPLNLYDALHEEFMKSEPPVEENPYSVLHAELCESTRQMLNIFEVGLHSLVLTGGEDNALLRSICWREEGGSKITIPVALRRLRRDLEWLEEFFKREPRK